MAELSSSMSTLSTRDVQNPFDFYRQHIAEKLSPIVNRPVEDITKILSWTITLDKGDLMLPTAALREKGVKPQDRAEEIASLFPTDDSVLVTAKANAQFSTLR